MSALPQFNTPQYAKLLRRTLPTIIRSKAQNGHYVQILEEMDSRSRRLTPEERELSNLLTLLIEEFEERRYAPRKKATPSQILKFLMDQHGLRQVDMIDVFGSKERGLRCLKRKTQFHLGANPPPQPSLPGLARIVCVVSGSTSPA